MSTVRITIHTDNAAFDDEEELPRILDWVGHQMLSGTGGRTIRDSNGNLVGTWTVDDE